MQDEELVRLFNDGATDPELADAVTAVRVVRDRATNVGKGVAYVEVSLPTAEALTPCRPASSPRDSHLTTQSSHCSANTAESPIRRGR